MERKLTIVDIARLSGVGKSTVSRVLNQDPRVKAVTRERVEGVIKHHGFIPSRSARAMRNRSQHMVGVIVSRLDSHSENQAVRGILSILYPRGYDAVLMESGFSPVKVNEHLEVLAGRGVDGVILFAFNGLDFTHLTAWQSRMVLIARQSPGFSSVCFDDRGVITGLLQRLQREGQQRIAYLGVKTTDFTTGQYRLDAYLDYCDQYGLAPRYALGSLDYRSAYHLMSTLLQPDTQALVCASDTLAIGAAKFLQEQGRTEVIVTGVGNNPLLPFLFPNILHLDPGYQEAGQQAGTQLLAHIELEQPPKVSVVSCQLV